MLQCFLRWATAMVVASTALVIPDAARANGRYPAAQQLALDPGNPDRLWLRATYGLLTSDDRGESWSWICETAVGYGGGGQEDPMLAVTASGTVLVATSRGLSRSSDGGCTWSWEPGIGSTEVVDIALERDRRHVLALAHVAREAHYELVMFRYDVETERLLSHRTIAEDLLGSTLDPAPSDPQRIYVTASSFIQPTFAENPGSGQPGGGDEAAFLARSSDGGQTWERLPIPGASLKQPAFIAAVHPTHPDTLYVRVQGGLNEQGVVESFLLYSQDAGATWVEIFRGSADLLGFALSADGSEVVIGLGDPRDARGARPVNQEALGVYRATDPEFHFRKVFNGHVGCLTQTEHGLFICGRHGSELFELGLVRDDASAPVGLVNLGDIQGPLKCEQGLGGDACNVEWESVCNVLGQCPSNVSPRQSDTLPRPQSVKDSAGSCSLIGAAFPGIDPAMLGWSVVGLCALRRRRGSK